MQRFISVKEPISNSTKRMKTRNIKAFLLLAMASISSLPMMGQDLLANQAPIDRKMKAVESVALKRLIETENLENPSADLYEDWDNMHAHSQVSEMPDSFLISLKNFCMPTTNRVLTSNFGARWGRQHKGLDIKVYIGDTIRAAFSGKVRVVQYERYGYGKYVVIRHDNGLETYYAHLSEQLVAENQEVHAGDPIGLGGNTGRSTGSHLHFETRLCGVALNPALMFDFRNQDVVDDSYMYRKSTYKHDSALASRLRGVNGLSLGSDGEDNGSEQASTSRVSSYRQEGRFHKVKRGETLYTIARKRGTSVSSLMKLNHLKKRSRIRPGQILKFN